MDRISLLCPDGKVQSKRLWPVANAFRTALPVSSSEPEIRRAVPVSVTSLMDAVPTIEFRDCCKIVAPCGAVAEGCWAPVGRQRSKAKTNGRNREKRTHTSPSVTSTPQISLQETRTVPGASCGDGGKICAPFYISVLMLSRYFLQLSVEMSVSTLERLHLHGDFEGKCE